MNPQFPSEDVLRQSIGDFPAPLTGVRKDEKFLRFVKEDYDLCRKAAEREQAEAERLWANYENVTLRDRYDSASAEWEAKYEVFRSAIAATKLWVLTCIILDAKPRIYLNPVFLKDAKQKIALLQNNPDAAWLMQGIADKQFEPFWNDILDKVVDEWWTKHQMSSKLQILVQRAVVQGRAWAKMRLDEKDRVVFENLPFNAVVADPYAETRADRRSLYHTKYMAVRDVEILYGLPKGTLKAEHEISGLKEEYANAPESLKNLSDEVKYKLPQCRVVEGYFKDLSQDESGNALYPNGRVLQFVLGQDTVTFGTGIYPLAEFPNQYSFWPIQDYIPKMISETRGLPISRNGEPTDRLLEKVVQQMSANLDQCGNTYIAYKSSLKDEIANLPNVPGYRIPFDIPGDIQFVTPGNVTGAAQAFVQLLNVILEDTFSVHDVTSGRRPGGVESGKGIMALQSSDVRSARPFIEALYAFLTPFATIFGQMTLAVAGEGFRVRYGKGYRASYELPLSLGSVIGDVETYVAQDSELPKDTMSIFNLLAQFADRLPLSVMLRFLPIEADKEMILQEVNEIEQLKQMIQQLQQQLQALGAEHQKMAGDMQGMAEENQEMQIAMQGKVVENRFKQAAAAAQAPITLQRESMRQQGKLQDTALRGMIQKDIASERNAASGRSPNKGGGRPPM